MSREFSTNKMAYMNRIGIYDGDKIKFLTINSDAKCKQKNMP